MGEAIGNAVVMLYAVSEKYKESGSCRLEASYARQLGVDMIPLTVEEGYLPTGWLRLVSRDSRWVPNRSPADPLRAACTCSSLEHERGTSSTAARTRTMRRRPLLVPPRRARVRRCRCRQGQGQQGGCC